MKRFTIILTTTLAFLLLASAVLFNACSPNPCKDIVCKNNGVCRDGRCKCSSGYEGPFCGSRIYEKFIGVWDGTYRCNGLVPKTITLIIAPDNENVNKIMIYNIFKQNVSISATVNIEETWKILLATQTIDGIEYSGYGTIESGKYITLFIQEKDLSTSQVSTCVFNGTKFSQQ